MSLPLTAVVIPASDCAHPTAASATTHAPMSILNLMRPSFGRGPLQLPRTEPLEVLVDLELVLDSSHTADGLRDAHRLVLVIPALDLARQGDDAILRGHVDVQRRREVIGEQV